MGVVLATLSHCPKSRCRLSPLESCAAGSRCPLSCRLEAEMREGLVRLGHPVHFLASLYRAAASFRGLTQFRGEPLPHRLLATLARGFTQPAHGKRYAAHRTHFDRYLEIGAADPPTLDLDHRLRVGERLVEALQRVLAAFLGNGLERTVDNPLGNRLLALAHEHVDELRDVAVRIFPIRQDLPL